ncbi:MAG: PaaI family thioesterase [Desulfatibacillaceae bacterium]
MSESLKSRALRIGFNLFPALRRSGGRITYFSADRKVLKMRLPLKLKTKNFVGTMFGGSMYSAIDGVYMVLFIRLLGDDYVVWDREARIRYLKPGRTDLTTEFRISDMELDAIRELLETEKSIERIYRIEWRDANGEVVCTIDKTLYFRKKDRQ